MKAHSMPEVAIILVNYNQPEVSRECLNSIALANFSNCAVWLVDNGSELSKRVSPKEYPWVNMIQSEINLGFAGGNNLAIEASNSEYVLLLNNDTEVKADLLDTLCNTLKKHVKAGIVSPKIRYHHTDHLIQYAGTGRINPLVCRGRTRGFLEQDQGQYDLEERTELSHGACMLIRRSLLEELGNLTEEYFLYYEEYDFCEMAKRNGWEVWFNGHTYITHKESVSTGRLSPLKSYYMARNRVRFALRNFNSLQALSSLLFFYFLALPKTIISESIHSRQKNAMAALHGAFNRPSKYANP